jgi:hypothetical protein
MKYSYTTIYGRRPLIEIYLYISYSETVLASRAPDNDPMWSKYIVKQ